MTHNQILGRAASAGNAGCTVDAGGTEGQQLLGASAEGPRRAASTGPQRPGHRSPPHKGVGGRGGTWQPLLATRLYLLLQAPPQLSHLPLHPGLPRQSLILAL